MSDPGRSSDGGPLRDGRARMGDSQALFEALQRINERPALYSRYTTAALWSAPDISEMMLRYHLDGELDLASRPTRFIEASVGWMVRVFELGPGVRVIDLGCGPGLYANRLAAMGASVTGIDISPRSIEHARAAADREGLAVEYVLGDYLTLEVDPAYDLAMLIMCDYCALSPAQRRSLLERVARILAPGGAFLFDVYSLAAFDTWEEQVAYGEGLMDGFWSASPYFGFLNTFRYEAERVVLEKYTILERDRLSEYLDWFAHFDVASLTAEVEAAGLAIVSVFGDVSGEAFDADAPEFAVVVQRR